MDTDTAEDRQRYRLLYEELPTLSLVLSQGLVIRDINRFGCEQLGYRRHELIGRPVRLLCPPEDYDLLEQNIHQCIRERDEPKRWEAVRLRKDASRFWVRDRVRVVEDARGELQVLISSEDITETRYLIGELERQSATDRLTGLLTRRRLERHLDELVLRVQAHGGQHVLLHIDLDHFKLVNDACGHLRGDEMLRRIAHLLGTRIRAGDKLARLGGDEFGVILDACTADDAVRIGEQILSTLADFRFSCGDMCFCIGASIGGVVIQAPGSSGEVLLHQAETACRVAKHKGRNRIQIDTSGFEDAGADRLRPQQWVSRLQSALDGDRFVLHSQRILGLADDGGSASQHEILIRMRGDGDELVPPGAFIEAAEYYNIAPRIDRWVTRTLLQRHASRGDGGAVTYFVNLSGTTLGDKGFIEEVSELLRAGGDGHPDICFEITETAAIRDLATAVAFMEHFRALGCRFALDDFGSGFSSFGYLKSLPVDFIKIDGGFVRNMIDEPLDLAVVRAIHEVAEVFGKRTIAEYVETGALLERLRALGIDFAQGYHIQRPAPLSEEDR